MSYSVPLPDPATRPKSPKIEGVTERQRHHGRRLAQFHRMHLGEIARVRQAMERVTAGEGNAVQLAENITSMAMLSNFRLFGNLCGGVCEMLTGHHSIEDQWIFPELRDRSEGLRAVVNRLSQEHEVIHALLVDLEEGAIALIRDPGDDRAKALAEKFVRLEGFVVSHFGYEQTELEEALGFYDIDI